VSFKHALSAPNAFFEFYLCDKSVVSRDELASLRNIISGSASLAKGREWTICLSIETEHPKDEVKETTVRESVSAVPLIAVAPLSTTKHQYDSIYAISSSVLTLTVSTMVVQVDALVDSAINIPTLLLLYIKHKIKCMVRSNGFFSLFPPRISS
jgi:hypothetical protein